MSNFDFINFHIILLIVKVNKNIEVNIPNKANTGNLPILNGTLKGLLISVYLYLKTITLKLIKVKVKNKNILFRFATN